MRELCHAYYVMRVLKQFFRICVYIYLCGCVYIYVCVHAYVTMCTFKCAHIITCLNMYIYMHTHLYYHNPTPISHIPLPPFAFVAEIS